MKSTKLFWLFLLISFWHCSSGSALHTYGQAFQKQRNYNSLKLVVDLMELGVDTAQVKAILGEPIDMGFDYRYVIDSVGPNGCVIGAVFHINSTGKIDQKWIDEICE